MISIKDRFIYLYKIYRIWFGGILWHLHHSMLFNSKSSLYIYIKYIYDLVNLWHINHCWLFNAKSFLYVYSICIWFGLLRFYDIWNIKGYLMSNPLWTYILNIWFVNAFCLNIFKRTSAHSLYTFKWFYVLLCNISHCLHIFKRIYIHDTWADS